MQSTVPSKAPEPKSPRTSAKILATLAAAGSMSTPTLSVLCHDGKKINQLLAQLVTRKKIRRVGLRARPGRRPVMIWALY